jgi:hypothetical protein
LNAGAISDTTPMMAASRRILEISQRDDVDTTFDMEPPWLAGSLRGSGHVLGPLEDSLEMRSEASQRAASPLTSCCLKSGAEAKG